MYDDTMKEKKEYWEYPAIRVLQIMWSVRALIDGEHKFRLRASTKWSQALRSYACVYAG